MKLLAIDTSTRDGGVAVLVDDALAAERRAHVTTHAERLLPMIDEALAEAALRPAQLDAVAVVAGPGSFTGLRIGLATAKGLCFAQGLPLLLVSSLEALAARAPDGTHVCALLDAYKAEVYAGLFVIEERVPKALPWPGGETGERVLPPAELAQELAQLSEVVLVGDGAHAYPELRALGRLLDHDPAPHPGDVARLAARRLARGEVDDLATAGPRYLRPSEPELLRMKRDKLKPG
jgi:tRNA threonylcarbamoyladenosine biosynthesis protein TsaB